MNNPEITLSEAVVSRTKDTVMETTGNEVAATTGETANREGDPREVEAAVNTVQPKETEATVDEGIPIEIKVAVDRNTPVGTESTVMRAAVIKAILREIEDIVISTVRYTQMRKKEAFKDFLEKRAARWTSRMWSRTKHPANDHFKRLHNKTEVTPIQKDEGNNFVVMKRLLWARVIDAGVDYDKEGKVISYRLFHPIIQGHLSQTGFDTEFKNHREADTRSIYFFELERMIEYLMDDPSVSMQTMEPILNYHTLRKREFDERYGNWLMHDDTNYLFP